MKIVHINAIYGKGSTGRICEELTEWLNANGNLCTTLYAFGNQLKNNSKQVSSFWRVHINGFLARIFGIDMGFSLLSTYQVIHYLRKETPDIVHLHNLHSHYINLNFLLKFLAKSNIPTVITLHDCWFFTGKCTHYTDIQCYKWQKKCGDCPKLKDDIPSFFFDRTSYMLRKKKKGFSSIKRLGVIGVSNWITSQARHSFLKNAAEIKRIYNWIDIDVFKPREVKVWKNKYVEYESKIKVLCISGSWDKNSVRFRDLIELSRRLSDKFQIFLVGNCKTPQDLPSNISYLGYIEDTVCLAEVYSYVDIYVHLSHEDTFGKVVAEAMACGTPAIVYNTTALPELVAEGRGFVVKKGCPTDIVLCLDEFKNQGKEVYSLKCIDFVRKNFQKETLLEETLNFYKSLTTL